MYPPSHVVLSALVLLSITFTAALHRGCWRKGPCHRNRSLPRRFVSTLTSGFARAHISCISRRGFYTNSKISKVYHELTTWALRGTGSRCTRRAWDIAKRQKVNVVCESLAAIPYLVRSPRHQIYPFAQGCAFADAILHSC